MIRTKTNARLMQAKERTCARERERERTERRREREREKKLKWVRKYAHTTGYVYGKKNKTDVNAIHTTARNQTLFFHLFNSREVNRYFRPL